MYRVVLHSRKVNIIFSFTSLQLHVKRPENSYEVTFFNRKATRLIMRKCIMIGTCDELKVQSLSCDSLAMVHSVQLVKI